MGTAEFRITATAAFIPEILSCGIGGIRAVTVDIISGVIVAEITAAIPSRDLVGFVARLEFVASDGSHATSKNLGLPIQPAADFRFAFAFKFSISTMTEKPIAK